MAEFSENWRRQVSPLLDSVQKHSNSLSAQVGGLQPLIQKFSESFFDAKNFMIDTPQMENEKPQISADKPEEVSKQKEPTDD